LRGTALLGSGFRPIRNSALPSPLFSKRTPASCTCMESGRLGGPAAAGGADMNGGRTYLEGRCQGIFSSRAAMVTPSGLWVMGTDWAGGEWAEGLGGLRSAQGDCRGKATEWQMLADCGTAALDTEAVDSRHCLASGIIGPPFRFAACFWSMDAVGCRLGTRRPLLFFLSKAPTIRPPVGCFGSSETCSSDHTAP